MEDFWQSVGCIIHASNSDDACSEASTRLLHDAIDEIMQGELQQWPTQKVNEAAWNFLNLLRQPQVVWGTGDPLTFEREPVGIRQTLILPTNTDLDSTAGVVKAAKLVCGQEPFDELRCSTPAKMGGVIETGSGHANGFSRIAHLIVRVPKDQELVGLAQAMQSLGTRRLHRYLLPLFGKTFDVARWAEVLAPWITAPRNIQAGRVSVLIQVPASEQEKAERLELELIRRGIMVGRTSESTGAPMTRAGTFKDELASRVRRGTLHPEVFARWLYSGASLPIAGWQRHVAFLS